MKPQLFLFLAALTVSGCASSPSGGLPICDGKHLRPANPNGSVLDPSASTAPAAALPSSAGAAQPGCGA